jgi:nitrogen fixation/metabolism regulation signal transduction histidine kinase
MDSSPADGATSLTHPRQRKIHFERRVLLFSALLVIPGFVITAILLWTVAWPFAWKLAVLGVELCFCLLIGMALHDHTTRPIRTLANVVSALREEDYSFRARFAVTNDALGELSMEVNTLADVLALRRTGSVEAGALLQRVIQEVDIPIFAFDAGNRLHLVNTAAGKLLQQPSAQLLGKTASELGLQDSLSCENETLISPPFANGARWLARRSLFRQQGVPHFLVVLSDVSRALREEERQAWQRLIRVIGHELNNSLAPIKSIAGSLNTRLSQMNLTPDQQEDFERGLGIIESRADSLNRFLQAYRQLAQMPAPVLQSCSLPTLVRHAAALETRVGVTVIPGPDVKVMADPDQIQQMLINLFRNAAEATLAQPAHKDNSEQSANAVQEPNISCSWELSGKEVIFTIEDNGPGLLNPANTFVPFYTTKQQGSGIGLVLSRQIAEAHGGSVELTNRGRQQGCAVKVRLPWTG